jgi:Leucine-rich repeat (LRR) protein
MSKDLETIKELEKIFDCKLKKQNTDIAFQKNSYQVDDNENVIALSLYEKGLNQIPNKIFELKNLTELDLCYNHLTELHSEIAQLQKLSILYLSTNNITELPSENRSITKYDRIVFD